METAKVDIRKLQALNDRINQCIDALNQVRLSVHGLSHTASPFGPGAVNPLGQAPVGGLGFAGLGQNPLAQAYGPYAQGFSPYGQGLSPYGQGFSHSTPFLGTTPSPFIPGIAQGLAPFAGLSHSSPEEAFARSPWSDPYVAVRIAHTFPYAQYPFPPVVTIF